MAFSLNDTGFRFSWVFLGPIALILISLKLKFRPIWLRGLVAFCYAIAIWGAVNLFPLAIFLRDGLGPDSITSSGKEAVLRALPLLAMALAFSAFFLVLGKFLSRFSRRPNQSFNPDPAANVSRSPSR